jgi:hypothetical protein
MIKLKNLQEVYGGEDTSEFVVLNKEETKRVLETLNLFRIIAIKKDDSGVEQYVNKTLSIFGEEQEHEILD